MGRGKDECRLCATLNVKFIYGKRMFRHLSDSIAATTYCCGINLECVYGRITQNQIYMSFVFDECLTKTLSSGEVS
eukprot:735106-Amphidinium_carterae.1